MAKVKSICFDRVLPRDFRRAIPFRAVGGGRTRAITPLGKLWPNGSVLEISFLQGSASQRSTVERFAREWTRHINLRFDFDSHANPDIRIAFADDGAWSYIGTDAKGIPAFQPTMNFGWLDEAVVLHEFGHAIGLAHEHQNPDGGIQWNEQAVIRDLSGPPNFWDEETIRHNVLNKYRHDQIKGTAFDPESIMLYSFPAEWTNGTFHSDPNTKLSRQDKDFAGGAQMYPGSDAPEDREVELQVSVIAATPASIGEFGEEDLFWFKTDGGGSHTIETEGETDVVMKLYGPDVRTQLIAEDDDGGKGLNPRITADLLPGKYFVQVRHYNRARGTGAYGIKVYR